MRAFQPWLPLDGGNRTLLLVGAAAAAAALEGGAGDSGNSTSGDNLTVLDFGGAVDLMYHPAGHSFYAYGLELDGLASTSAGRAAGLSSQMVNGYLWPTFTGEPQHLKVGGLAGWRARGRARWLAGWRQGALH